MIPSNGVDDSHPGTPVATLMQPRTDEEGSAVRSFIIIATLIALIVGGFVFMDSRAKDTVDEHAKRPHVGVVTEKQYEKDLKRIEGKVDAQDKKLDEILKEVRK